MRLSLTSQNISVIIKELSYEIHKDFVSQLSNLVTDGILVCETKEAVITLSPDSADLKVGSAVVLRLRDQEIIDGLKKEIEGIKLQKEAVSKELAHLKEALITVNEVKSPPPSPPVRKKGLFRR